MSPHNLLYPNSQEMICLIPCQVDNANKEFGHDQISISVIEEKFCNHSGQVSFSSPDIIFRNFNLRERCC